MSKNENSIVIDVAQVEALIDTLGIQEINPHSYEMRVREGLSQLLKKMLADYNRLKENPTTPEQWDIVEPKPGKNNFRAGNTAYGRAVMLYPDEGVFVSEDGKHAWKGFDINHHVVVGRLSPDEIVMLNASHGRYPIVG